MNQFEAECEYWLEKANECVENYIDQTDYEWLFEANKETENNNKNVKGKTDTLIGNAARAVIKMIENILASIRDFLANKLSRKRINTVRNNLQQSGKGNKTVKVPNTKKAKEAWGGIFKSIDNEINNAQKNAQNAPETSEGNSEDNESGTIIQSIENMVVDKLKGFEDNGEDISKMGSAWITTLTAEAALRAATTDAETAQAIARALEEDKNLMKKLEEDLGKARARNYKRKIKELSKTISLVRFRSKLRGQYIDSIAGAATSVINDVEHMIKNPSSIAKDQVQGSFASSRSSEEKRNAARRADLATKIATNKHNVKGARGVVKSVEQGYRTKELVRHATNTPKEKNFFDKLLYGNN